VNSGDAPGIERLRAAIFRQPRVRTSSARRRPETQDRSEWSFASWVRRNPGLAVCTLFMICVGLLVWPETGVSVGQFFSNQPEEQARRAVADVLDVIGPEVVIDAVEIDERDPGVAATFFWPTRTITISPDIFSYYSDEEFLWLVSHEVVHAMFFQMDWGEIQGSANWRSFLLPHETAAEVLGAHIAGRAYSRRGGNGRHLTERFVRRHRNLCDTQSPHGFYQRFARARDRSGVHAVDEEWEYLVFTHVSSIDMVDEMDRICRESPDPWHAVRVIGEKYLFTDHEVVTAAKESSADR